MYLVVFYKETQEIRKMKPKILIATAAICILHIIPSNADVTQCIEIPHHCMIEDGSLGGYDWGSSCYGRPVYGIAVCSSQEGGTIGEKVSRTNLDNTSSNNKYCWCRVIGPAVSYYWLYNGSYGSASTCSSDCAYDCAYSFAGSESFRTAAFSSLM